MRRVIGIAALVAFAAGLFAGFAPGCDRRSDASKRVNSAATELHAMSGGGSAPAMPTGRDASFKSVSARVQPALDAGVAGTKAAAALLTAQTEIGLAEAPALEAAAAERTLRHQGTVVLAILSDWSLRNAAGAAAASYDPSAELAAIATAKADRQRQAAGERERRAVVEREVNDLRAKAAERIALADAEEAEYTRQMQEAVRLTATQAAGIVEAANVFKRKADGFRLEGSRLEAQADSVAPRLTEATAIVDQLTNQARSLDARAAEIAREIQDFRAEADAARAGAQAAATDLNNAVADAERHLTESFESSIASAITLYGKAAKSARTAQEAAPASGRLAAGDAHQSLGDMHLRRAQTLSWWSGLLEGLATVQPPLPDAAEYGRKAKEAADASLAARAEAQSAFGSAESAFSGVPGGKARLEALIAALANAAKSEADRAADAAATPDASPAAAATPAEPAPAIPASTAPADPALAAAVRSLAEDARGLGQAEVACRAKFNVGLVEVLSTVPGMGPMLAQQVQQSAGDGDLAALATVNEESYQVVATGDVATLSGPGVPAGSQFRRVGGAWVLYNSQLEAAGITPEQFAKQSGMLKAANAAIRAFAADVQAGTYADPAAAGQGFMQKLQAAMTPPPGGG